jgi:hypothetical protein
MNHTSHAKGRKPAHRPAADNLEMDGDRLKVSFLKGTLTVAVDSTTLRAELDAQLRGGLLKTLQAASRGRLFRIKTCVQAGPP